MTGMLTDINPQKDIFIFGDFNARMGRDCNSLIVGQYGEGIVNVNRGRLIDMCRGMSLKILNGFFTQKEIHKFT